ncbi:phosphatase PAP2 family protein [Metabacillus mangrovi]|nr:phosphatase PAP2 family protein [Metabacillus mangrovi]
MKDIRKVLLLLAIFCILAVIYSEDWFTPFDGAIVLFFENNRTSFLNDYFIFFTELGSGKTIFPLLLGAAVVMAYRKLAPEAVFLFICFAGSRLFNWLLKNGFDRERPSYDPLLKETTYSFPSGHAMNSAAFFTFAGFLTARYYPQHKPLIYSVMAYFIVSISFSRVYIGVHYLSDISAGICAGLIWFFVCKNIYTAIRQK